MSDAQAIQDMDEVDKHWTAHLHTLFVLYMAWKTITGTLSASKSWSTSKLKMGGPAQMLLLLNAALVAVATAYKFTSKHIPFLFVIHCASHYGFLLAFYVLVEFNENNQIRDQGRKILSKLTFMHGLFAFVMVYGYFKQSGCDKHTYPLGFVLSDVLYFVTFGACMRFNKVMKESNMWASNPSEKEQQVRQLTEA
jgi:hypothetical protein